VGSERDKAEAQQHAERVGTANDEILPKQEVAEQQQKFFDLAER